MNPRLRLLVLALAVALGLAAAEGPAGRAVEPLAGDLARWLRAWLEPAPPDPSGRVVVVALDEESHLREPFKSLPRVLWTPQIGAVVQAALDAGASVVALDILLEVSSSQVGDADYDRPLRRALLNGAKQNKIVIAQQGDAERPIVPHGFFQASVRNRPENIRPANLPLDPDGAARRVFVALKDGSLAFAAEIARRTGAAIPDRPDMILDTTADPTPVVTLSLADIYECVQAGRAEVLRELLGDRVVLIGAMVQDVDRFRASNRFAMTWPERLPDRRCMEETRAENVPPPAKGMIAGVQLQAMAVEQLLVGRMPREAPLPVRVALLAVAGLLAALPFALLGASPLAVALAAAVVLLPLPAAAAALPGLILPSGRLMASALTASLTALLLREALVGRALRRLRSGFALYLPKPEVDRMLALGMPELGGEEREVTTLFADLAGFTPLAEKMSPPELVALLNQHFERLGAEVERQGGFVLQYLGDGMLAVFGAPAPLADAPTAAVDAAVACLAAVESAQPRLRLRIGIATGTALVGNIGSPHRFNYAVVGDVVNLSARLEGMNKQYGTSIMVGETTAKRYAGRHGLLEIDRVAVVGRSTVLSLHVPRAQPDPDRDGAFGIALDAYRSGNFGQAAALFAALADALPAAGALAERCRLFAVEPPAAAGGWDGVFRPTQK